MRACMTAQRHALHFCALIFWGAPHAGQSAVRCAEDGARRSSVPARAPLSRNTAGMSPCSGHGCTGGVGQQERCLASGAERRRHLALPSRHATHQFQNTAPKGNHSP
jgi:hypothetical protein